MGHESQSREDCEAGYQAGAAVENAQPQTVPAHKPCRRTERERESILQSKTKQENVLAVSLAKTTGSYCHISGYRVDT